MNLGPVKQAEDPYQAKQDQRGKRYRCSFHGVQVCGSEWKFSTEFACLPVRGTSSATSSSRVPLWGWGERPWYRNRPVQTGDARHRPTMDYRTRTMPTGTQRGNDPANYYVWRAPGGFSVHLGLHVIRELAAQTAASGETCGLSLGRSITAPSPIFYQTYRC
jgi:hypothetical protein